MCVVCACICCMLRMHMCDKSKSRHVRCFMCDVKFAYLFFVSAGLLGRSGGTYTHRHIQHLHLRVNLQKDVDFESVTDCALG